MQRNNYPPGPNPASSGASPPLHHPVPQHHVPIPVMHSPPPPASYGNSYAPSSVPHPAYGFLADPTAQMAFQVGGRATEVAGQYVEQNFGRYLQVSALKHYFDVSNGYVLQKLSLVLFPWRHKPWSRTSSRTPSTGSGAEGSFYLPPREDVNSPDMYIPVMAFVTYILLSTLLYGLAGRFNPEQLGYTASFAFTIVILEIVIIKIGCYVLSINESQLLDLVAYSGYKFVGIIVTLGVTALGSKWLEYAVFGYAFNANAFFLLRSLKYVLLPDSTADNPRSTTYAVNRTQKNRRTQFLFLYSYFVQLVFMWSLSSGFDFRSATAV